MTFLKLNGQPNTNASWVFRLCSNARRVLFPAIALTLCAPVFADRDPNLGERGSTSKPVDIRAKSQREPAKSLKRAVEQFKKDDPDAAFSYYLGHVDQFTTSAKEKTPNYAAKVLSRAGLSVKPVKPVKMQVSKAKKRGSDLDQNLSTRMPALYENDIEVTQLNKEPDKESNDKSDGANDDAKRHSRVKPNEVQPEPLWSRPSDERLTLESKVAKSVLTAFLKQHQSVFEISDKSLARKLPNLIETGYTVGKYARKARYQQRVAGKPLIGGDLLVLFDHNWNVINVSRMIANTTKMSLKRPDKTIDRADALKIAQAHIAKNSHPTIKTWASSNAVLGIDPIRRHEIWLVNLKANAEGGHDDRVKVHAQTGKVLNVSDNIDRYSDAKVRRWGYPSGHLEVPNQYVSENFYTRDNNNLVHDFFHIVTDGRGGGDPEVTCTSTSEDTLWYEEAYGTESGSSYVRPTSRNDRDFSLWQPYSVAGSFSESNSYYWARWFFQWIKGSISDLGELPNASSDYQQVMIVANACISAGGLYENSGRLTTLNDQGEGIPVIKLPEKCKRDNPNCSSSDYNDYGTFTNCQGDGCSSPPSVIHHEINHFLLKQYYDVQSGIDCSIGEELKHLHEGILGSVVPQAYWHHYYNVGYDPADNFMYKVHYDAGLVHSNNSTLLTLSDYACDDDGDPYKSGRVAGQAMWKILHGNSVNGSTISSMPRPATDRDFLNLTYWAAELVDTSTFKDRYEYANRVMQIMEQNSNLSSSGKAQWCDTWEQHELGRWIVTGYCS